MPKVFVDNRPPELVESKRRITLEEFGSYREQLGFLDKIYPYSLDPHFTAEPP